MRRPIKSNAGRRFKISLRRDDRTKGHIVTTQRAVKVGASRSALLVAELKIQKPVYVVVIEGVRH